MLSPHAPSALSGHHPLGLSTGCFADIRGAWEQLAARAAGSNPFAVEIAALSEWELDGALAYLRSEPMLPFRYVALHGPSKSRTMPEAELVRRLAAAPAWVQTIVVHPDTMEEPERYAALGRRLAIENMDARKQGGRSAEELEAVFAALPLAGFCLDVAHAFSVGDHIAAELLDAFRARLRQVHVSSLDEELHHVSLRPEDEDLFGPVLRRCRDVPWILEGAMAS